MKSFVVAATAIMGLASLAACESSSEYDGVSRFASTPYYGPGSPPREKEAPPAPEIPGRTDQDGLNGIPQGSSSGGLDATPGHLG